MSSLSNILEIARRSLTAQRLGMDVTGHNIANSGTAGYTRQRVDLAATDPLHTSYGYLGTGVTATHIGRIREQFIDAQVRTASDALGSASTKQTILSQVEATLNEPSDSGLSSALSGFFNAFNDLSLHPEDTSYRTAVLQKAGLLTQSFHQLTTNIQQLQGDLWDNASSKVTEINQLTRDISALDKQIVSASADGDDPSDLKDQRDLKLDRLSQLAKITVSEDKGGSMLVSIGGTMVSSRAGSVDLSASIVNGQITVTAGDANTPISTLSGELGGVVETYNKTIPGYLSALDRLAGTLMQQVNAVHASGYGLGNPPSTGINFFTGTTASDIAVNPSVASDPSLIAASQDGRAGSNGTARSIAALSDAPVFDGGTTSIPKFYANLVSTIGSDINAASTTQQTQELVVNQLKTQRDSVSGVSVDEEMTNLIQYQRAFDASARVVTAVDQMMQTIIQMV